jgi:hypothetical protein
MENDVVRWYGNRKENTESLLSLFKKQVSLLDEGQINNAERNFVKENKAKLPFSPPKQTDRK